jgi:hypothetical protein
MSQNIIDSAKGQDGIGLTIQLSLLAIVLISAGLALMLLGA